VSTVTVLLDIVLVIISSMIVVIIVAFSSWLSDGCIFIFLLATLAYCCQHNMAAHYLAIQLNQASSDASRQRLRSASTPELIVPRTSRSTIGDRAFCVTAARAWNTLTPSVQSSESLAIFRRRLKTELFSRSFPD